MSRRNVKSGGTNLSGPAPGGPTTGDSDDEFNVDGAGGDVGDSKASKQGKRKGQPNAPSAASSSDSDLDDDDELLTFEPITAKRKPIASATASNGSGRGAKRKPQTESKPKPSPSATAASSTSRKASASQSSSAPQTEDADDGEADSDWIEAEFEFYDPQPEDWWAIKELLKAYIDDSLIASTAKKKHKQKQKEQQKNSTEPTAPDASAERLRKATADVATPTDSDSKSDAQPSTSSSSSNVKRTAKPPPRSAKAGVARAPPELEAALAENEKRSGSSGSGTADEDGFDAMGLAKLIGAQVEVGTMIKSGGRAEQPLAFITVLNWNALKHEHCMQQLQAYLLASAPTAPVRDKLSQYLSVAATPSASSARASSASSTSASASPISLGVLLHERVVNTPAELLPHFHTALADDMEWAATHSEQKAAYRYTHFLLISKCLLDSESGRLTASGSVGSGAAGKKRAKKPKPAASHVASLTQSDVLAHLKAALFLKFEDQFYAETASLVYFPRDSPQSKGLGLEQSATRVVMIVPASAVRTVAKRLTEAVGTDVIDESEQPDQLPAPTSRGRGRK